MGNLFRRKNSCPLASECKSGREANGGFHAVGTDDAATGDTKSRAVIGARADKWQAERDIYSFVEGMELERDEALVVIHAQDPVELAFDSAVENGIRRKRALEIDMALQFCDGWRDDFDFLAAEVAVFASVGVETGDGDARFGNSSGAQEVCEKFSHTDDFGGGEKNWNAGERNMGCNQRDGERAAGEAHGEVFDSGAAGEEFGLAGKIKSDLVHGTLADRAGDDRLPITCGELLGSGFQGQESLLGGFRRGTTRQVFL